MDGTERERVLDLSPLLSGGEWVMRSHSGHGGAKRTSLREVEGNDLFCCCTWREKGRQATAGRRSMRSRGQVINLNVWTGHALSHLPLPSSHRLSWPLHSHPTWWKMSMNVPGIRRDSSSQSNAYPSWIAMRHVVLGEFLKSRPVPESTTDYFHQFSTSFPVRKRPHFVLLARVTQFLHRPIIHLHT